VFCRATTNRIIIEGELTKMFLTSTQEIDLAIKPLDAKGNAAQVDGTPEWVSSDPNIVLVAPSTDGLSCVAKAMAIGHAQISVAADADLNEGIETLTGTIEFNVVAGNAVSLGIIAGSPHEQA